jgi:pimeloyl-ACP methyl ester carboxylesterase
MPYAQNQSVRIHYEVEGGGPPILLAYGLLGSVTLWRETGYIDRLKDEATVIAFDARGHGRSDKPHEPEAYTREALAGDVVAVMDALDLPKVHFWGYSMGAFVGYTMAEYHQDRLLSLILGGAAPFQAKPADTNPAVELFTRGVEEGSGAVIQVIEQLQGPMPGPLRRNLETVDWEAMVAYSRCGRSNLEEEACRIRVPCLLYAGDGDEEPHQYGQEAARTQPNTRFLSVPGHNHTTGSDVAEKLVPEVLAFVREVEGS